MHFLRLSVRLVWSIYSEILSCGMSTFFALTLTTNSLKRAYFCAISGALPTSVLDSIRQKMAWVFESCVFATSCLLLGSKSRQPVVFHPYGEAMALRIRYRRPNWLPFASWKARSEGVSRQAYSHISPTCALPVQFFVRAIFIRTPKQEIDWRCQIPITCSGSSSSSSLLVDLHCGCGRKRPEGGVQLLLAFRALLEMWVVNGWGGAAKILLRFNFRNCRLCGRVWLSRAVRDVIIRCFFECSSKLPRLLNFRFFQHSGRAAIFMVLSALSAAN